MSQASDESNQSQSKMVKDREKQVSAQRNKTSGRHTMIVADMPMPSGGGVTFPGDPPPATPPARKRKATVRNPTSAIVSGGRGSAGGGKADAQQGKTGRGSTAPATSPATTTGRRLRSSPGPKTTNPSDKGD